MTGTATQNGPTRQTNGHASGRDPSGRFAPGNKLGTGNPFARLVAGMRQQLVHRVTPAELDAVVDQLVLLAKGGDLGAIKLLLGYLVGKPAEVVNPDTLDLDEWQARTRLPDQAEAEAVMARVPFGLLSVAANAMDAVQWETARDLVENSTARRPAPKKGPAGDAPPTPRPSGTGSGKPARYSPHTISAGRMTAALGTGSKKVPESKRKAESIFQKLRRKGAANEQDRQSRGG